VWKGCRSDPAIGQSPRSNKSEIYGSDSSEPFGSIACFKTHRIGKQGNSPRPSVKSQGPCLHRSARLDSAAQVAYNFSYMTMPMRRPAFSLVCLLCAPICLAQSPDPAKNQKPLAVIDGQPVTEDDLLPYVQSQLRPLREQEYQVKKKALDNLVNQKLLEAEAKKKGVTTEKLLEQEVDAKVADPTDAELLAYYLAQKGQLNRLFNEVKAQIQPSLKQAKIQQARQDYSARLREQAKVSILLGPPRTEVGFDPARVRGNPKAKVMIVEFSDFQCPYCREVQPTLKNVLAKHEGTVALAFRDLPVTQIHPQAQLAAEAARCAAEQGKFWEYHDLLFADQAGLDRNGLLTKAIKLSLDAKQFEACLTAEKYKPQVQQDSQDGMRAGVSGTPGFFINGIFLNGAQPEPVFEKTIQEQLPASPK
jgi:protein-disulfide isomerase